MSGWTSASAQSLLSEKLEKYQRENMLRGSATMTGHTGHRGIDMIIAEEGRALQAEDYHLLGEGIHLLRGALGTTGAHPRVTQGEIRGLAPPHRADFWLFRQKSDKQLWKLKNESELDVLLQQLPLGTTKDLQRRGRIRGGALLGLAAGTLQLSGTELPGLEMAALQREQRL